MLTSKEKSDTRRLPMMPIRDVVIFPFMMTPFVVGRESSVRALEEETAADGHPFRALFRRRIMWIGFAIAFLIMLTGVPVYLYWSRHRRTS